MTVFIFAWTIPLIISLSSIVNTDHPRGALFARMDLSDQFVCGNYESRLLEGQKIILTVVVDGVDQSDADMSMVVGYQHNIKKLLAVWIELPQLAIYCLQCLTKHKIMCLKHAKSCV